MATGIDTQRDGDAYQPAETGVYLSPSARDSLFGRLAVHTGLLEQETVNEVAGRQATRPERPLADLLVESGALSNKARQCLEVLLEEWVARHGTNVCQDLSSRWANRFNVDDTVGQIASLNGVPSPQGQLGDYEILAELGRGGMGVVYKARQVKLNRLVALKMIRSGQWANDDEVRRFRAEAEAAATLDHPGIVPVHEVGQINGQHFFSMALIPGVSLNDKVRAEGPLAPRLAAEILQSVAEAVEFAHGKQIIHRDIKPQNILLDEAGRPRLTDFGLAKRLQVNSDLTVSGQVVGTPGYMPPEQVGGTVDAVGPAADVYALGATLYFLLTARPPFQAATPTETLRQVLETEPVPPRRLNPAIARDLETICLKCLRKEPGKRYATPLSLAEDLQRWRENRPILARRVPLGEKVWLWCRRRPTIVGLLLAFVAIMVTAGLFAWRQQQAARAQGLVDALLNAETTQVPELLREVKQYDRWTGPLLRHRIAHAEEDSTLRLHAALALVANDPQHVDYLYERLLRAQVDDVPVIAQALEPHADQLMERLWAHVSGGNNDERLRAAAALAIYAPDEPRWSAAAADVVTALSFAPLEEWDHWIRRLQPAAEALTPAVAARYEVRGKTGKSGRAAAATALAQYCSDQPERVVEFILTSQQATEFRPLLQSLRAESGEASSQLAECLSEKPPTPTSTDDRDEYWRRQATAAASLLELNRPESVWPALDNPSVKSAFIERLAPLGVDLRRVLAYLEDPALKPSARQALILALGDYDLANQSQHDQRRATQVLTNIFQADHDSGVHEAAQWTLRQWRAAVSSAPNEDREVSQRHWFVNSQGQPFLIVRGPVKFSRGDATLQVAELSHGFAMATCETSLADFQKFRPAHSFSAQYAPQKDCPVNQVSWFDAVAYCNWLSEQDGLPREQWCYEPNEKGEYAAGMTIPADSVARRGYRLPLEAEWECVCRAGTDTPFSSGDSEKLATRYAWVLENSRDRSSSTGTLKPNAFGAYDMHGNVWEWCHDWQQATGETPGNRLVLAADSMRILRGGSFVFAAAKARSSSKAAVNTNDRRYNNGFRVARSLP